MGKLISSEAVGVLQSFRPYLGVNGSSYVTVLENLLEVISGEPAQKMIGAFRLFGSDEVFQTMEVREERANPFSLFLILILLMLADPAADNKTGEAAVQAEVPKPGYRQEGGFFHA